MKAVVTYHSIDPSGSVISVHPDRFARHVEILRDGELPVVTLTELLRPECERGVALTFDDAFQNLADVAWPILSEAELPATVFVPTDWVGRDNAWDADDDRIPLLELMDWSTLERLASEGLEVESHGRSHRRMTSLDEDQVWDELDGSRAALRSRLGIEASVFCYPYGDVDDRVEAAVRDAGYRAAVTTELSSLPRPLTSPFTLPRLDAFYLAKPGIMERLGTPALDRYLAFRRVARKLRGTLRRTGASA